VLQERGLDHLGLDQTAFRMSTYTSVPTAENSVFTYREADGLIKRGRLGAPMWSLSYLVASRIFNSDSADGVCPRITTISMPTSFLISTFL
jgi:hypothetical protein